MQNCTLVPTYDLIYTALSPGPLLLSEIVSLSWKMILIGFQSPSSCIPGSLVFFKISRLLKLSHVGNFLYVEMQRHMKHFRKLFH